jgi:hypothetical protein
MKRQVLIIPGTEHDLSVHLTGMYDTRMGKLQMFIAATSERATISLLHNRFVWRKNITRHETSYGNEMADSRASAQHTFEREYRLLR